MTIPLVPGLAALAADYDALILDLWGVVHDGVAPYRGVIDCLERWRGLGKRVVILSNAPRRSVKVVDALGRMGIGDALYECAITSGDATRRALAERSAAPYAALGHAYFYMGKEGDGDLLDGLDYGAVENLSDAAFVLNTGLAVDAPHVDAYEEELAACISRGLPMICANPDLAAIRAGNREACAGALAARYAELGGEVAWQGKPWPMVYGLCLDALAGIDRARILAVGDSLATDISGARAAGINALLVTGGLLADAWGTPREAPTDAGRLAVACAEAGVTPTMATATFIW